MIHGHGPGPPLFVVSGGASIADSSAGGAFSETSAWGAIASELGFSGDALGSTGRLLVCGMFTEAARRRPPLAVDAAMGLLRWPATTMIFCVAMTPALVLNTNSWFPGSTSIARPSSREVTVSPSTFTCTSAIAFPLSSVTTGMTEGMSEVSWVYLVVHSGRRKAPQAVLEQTRYWSLASRKRAACSLACALLYAALHAALSVLGALAGSLLPGTVQSTMAAPHAPI